MFNHWQKMYVYRLFTLSNNYLTRKSLPISFQNVDANTIGARKQPEDTVIWAESKKANSFEQWLACQVSGTQMVHLSYRVEPIQKGWQLDTGLLLPIIL